MGCIVLTELLNDQSWLGLVNILFEPQHIFTFVLFCWSWAIDKVKTEIHPPLTQILFKGNSIVVFWLFFFNIRETMNQISFYPSLFWSIMCFGMLHGVWAAYRFVLSRALNISREGKLTKKKECILPGNPTSFIYLAENCNLKDGLRQGQYLLYGPILYIQQWIYTLNEMEGGEMLKSPSPEVLSTGAWYKKTPNDNLHALATASLPGHVSMCCQVWEGSERDIGSKSTSASRFLLKAWGHWI